jgi:hypothetical protein
MAEISDEMYERLRQILEKQNRRTYTLEGAKEIGDGLVGFFELLMGWAEENHAAKGNDEDQRIEQWF